MPTAQLVDLAEARRIREERQAGTRAPSSAAGATVWRPGFVVVPWIFPMLVPTAIPVETDRDGR